jgi:hypothetical protein
MSDGLTKEGMRLLIEEIVDLVYEFENDIESQFNAIRTTLRVNGGIKEVEE